MLPDHVSSFLDSPYSLLPTVLRTNVFVCMLLLQVPVGKGSYRPEARSEDQEVARHLRPVRESAAAGVYRQSEEDQKVEEATDVR